MSDLEKEVGDLPSKLESLSKELETIKAAYGLAIQRVNELNEMLIKEQNKNQDETFQTYWLMQYAGQAMQGYVSCKQHGHIDHKRIAEQAFVQARAMIAEGCPIPRKMKPSDLALMALESENIG